MTSDEVVALREERDRLIRALKQAESYAANGWVTKTIAVIRTALEPYRKAKAELRATYDRTT